MAGRAKPSEGPTSADIASLKLGAPRSPGTAYVLNPRLHSLQWRSVVDTSWVTFARYGGGRGERSDSTLETSGVGALKLSGAEMCSDRAEGARGAKSDAVAAEPVAVVEPAATEVDGTLPSDGGAASSTAAEVSAATEATTGKGMDIQEQLATLERNVLNAFESKIAFDLTKEKQIDRLHAELQGHRSDLVGRAIRPVFQSLVRLYDDFDKVLEALQAEDQAKLTAERLLGLLKGFRDDVELALEHNGVTAFRTDEEKFDPIRQRVARTIKTADESLIGLIAARVRPGFEGGGAIIERERVAVYIRGEEPPAQNSTGQGT